MQTKLYSTDSLNLYFGSDLGTPKTHPHEQNDLTLIDKDGKRITSMWIHGPVLEGARKFAASIHDTSSQNDPVKLQKAIHEFLSVLIQNGGYSSLKIANYLKEVLCQNELIARQSLEALQQTRAEWDPIIPEDNSTAAKNNSPAATDAAATPSVSARPVADAAYPSFFTMKSLSRGKEHEQTKSEVLKFIDDMITHIKSYLGLNAEAHAHPMTP